MLKRLYAGIVAAGLGLGGCLYHQLDNSHLISKNNPSLRDETKAKQPLGEGVYEITINGYKAEYLKDGSNILCHLSSDERDFTLYDEGCNGIADKLGSYQKLKDEPVQEYHRKELIELGIAHQLDALLETAYQLAVEAEKTEKWNEAERIRKMIREPSK